MPKMRTGKLATDRSEDGRSAFQKLQPKLNPVLTENLKTIQILINPRSNIQNETKGTNDFNYGPSYEERKQKYETARERIFSEKLESSGVSKEIDKVRTASERRKTRFKIVEAAIIRAASSDRRPYATVYIEGIKITGLLDSGATVSVLGRGCETLLKNLEEITQNFRSSVTTADGNNHHVRGFVKCNVEFRNKTKEICVGYFIKVL